MRGVVNVGTYFDYSGKIRNKVVEFKNMSDISYLSEFYFGIRYSMESSHGLSSFICLSTINFD